MLLFLLDRLPAAWPALGDLHGLGRAESRAALAALLSFVVGIACGRRLIAWLGQRFREPIKSASADVARLHRAKEGTPTMGGLFLVGGIVASALALGDWTNPFLVVAVLVMLALAIVGAGDDLIKLRTRSRGMRAGAKLAAQTAVALVATGAVQYLHAQADGPPSDAWLVDGRWGLFSLLLGTLAIVGASNAVNLTDGLDGLAGGCLVWAFVAIGAVSYGSGAWQTTQITSAEQVSSAGEMTLVAAATSGTLLAFLCFNCYPASVFMGNTGALPLGGLLGLLAVIARQEMLLIVIGGVFVAEALSVVLQVASWRLRGRRVFRCAPLHHHFQLQGWSEKKIVARFWLAAAVCAAVGLGTLQMTVARDAGAAQLATRHQLTPRLVGIPR